MNDDQNPQDNTQQADSQSQQTNNQTDDQTEQLKAELTKMTELAKRAMADFENFRRRQEEERKNFFTLANLQLIQSLLPILDNFERAKEHMPKGEEDWLKGINMSINNLQKTLEDFGLKPMQSLGQPFNPDYHEALIHSPGEKDIVTEELEKGYFLGEKIIRHAKVKVGDGNNPTA